MFGTKTNRPAVATPSFMQYHRSATHFSRLTVILAGAGLASLPLFENWEELAHLRLSQFILLFCCLSLFAEILTAKRRFFILPVSLRFFVAWALWAGATLLLMPTSESEPFWRYIHVAKTTALVIVFANVARTRHDVLIITLFLVVSAPVVFFLNYDTLTTVGALGGLERFSGTLGNSNILARYGVVVIWASLMLFCTTKHLMRNVVYLVVPCALLLILYSGSRQAMLALLVLVPLFFWCYFRRKALSLHSRAFLAVTTVFVFAVVVLTIVCSPFFDRVQDSISGMDGVTRARLGFYKVGIGMWLERPLVGFGFEQFRFQLENRGFYSHSTPIELLACTGIIGFVLYFASVTLIYVELWKCSLRRIPSVDSQILSFGMGLVLLLGVFHFSNVMFFSRIGWLLLAVFAGYAYRVSHAVQQGDGYRPLWSRRYHTNKDEAFAT